MEARGVHIYTPYISPYIFEGKWLIVNDDLMIRQRFQWPRPDAGFVWTKEPAHTLLVEIANAEGEDVTAAPGPFLTISPHTTAVIEDDQILEKTTVFLKFANLEETEESILTFANRYGHLNMFNKDESFGYWQQEIRDMKWLVQVWCWVEAKDESALSEIIRWSDDGHTVFCHEGYRRPLKLEGKYRKLLERPREWENVVVYDFLADKEHETSLLMGGDPSPMFERFKRGDVLLPAMYLVQREINVRMALRIGGGIGPLLAMNEKNELEQYLMPHSLLAALWLQFFRAASGQNRFRRCKWEKCRRWEDVTNKHPNWGLHENCQSAYYTARHREKKRANQSKAGV